MVYGCGFVMVGKPNCFMTSSEMRLFWLPFSIIHCSREHFTHIWEWKRCSSSSGSSSSSFYIFMVTTMVLGSASITYFPLSFPLLGSDSELEHAYDSKAFISATSYCLAQHLLMLWVELLWNSYHFPMSFFRFWVLFFTCGFGKLSWAAPPWICPLFFSLWAPFPCFGFADPKFRFFNLSLCLILTTYRYIVSSKEMSRNSIAS